ncbi:portal protein [Pseudophaeobacter sp. 1A09344]|uniref:portal protein n=1 Tax=Pseudophaeobacter sp. 1A09344 TaxID=3098144 RepID=UPI0034D63FCA
MKHDDLLKLARTRMAEAIEADRENRLAEMDDLEKLVGKHWPEDIRREREAENKPCLTMNRLPQFVRQVTGDIRRMNPAIKVIPADRGASKEVADIYEGLIRQIEYASNASRIYERAAEQAAASSIGWFRILNDYESDDSFLQELKIKGIRNPLSVYCDPAAELPTREDAGFIFITEQMPRTAFDKAYPGKSAADVDMDASTDGLEHWQENDKVVVAEYYWKEPVEREIVLLNDGSVIDAKDFVAPMPAIKRRKVKTHKVMWVKISGNDVLEGPQEQPCRHIPVVAVTGEEWHVGDRVHRSSVIRHAKDAQQMYNYWRSAQTEFAALQPKAPYLVTPAQIAGLETFWNQANQKNRPYLPYNPDPKTTGVPQRATPPISSQAMAEQTMLAGEDMKATTGIYDSALGNASNEKSGVAIRQRQMESDVSTSIYSDNMGEAIATAGRILIDMIPKVYDTQRVVRIMGDDDQEQMVEINGQMMQAGPDGMPVSMPVNDLTIGKYDIRVAVGPNYATRRQETAEGMLEFIRVVPGAASVTGDLIAKSMDWPDAEKFSERLKMALPPQFRDPDDMSPEEQQQMQQAMQQQAMQAQMQQAAQQTEMRKADAEAVEAEADAQKAQFEVMNEQLDLAAKNGQLNAAVSQLVQQEVARALSIMAAQQQQGRGPIF